MSRFMGDKTAYLYRIILFLFLFFVFSRSSTAGYNIFLGLLTVIVLTKIKQWKKIDISHAKFFLICYAIFFIALFLAAGLSGDHQSLSKTWRYFTWTLPFWLLYVSQSISFHDRILKWGLASALAFIAVSVVPQISTMTRVIGNFGQPTLLGTVLAILVPAGIMLTFDTMKRERWSINFMALSIATGLGIVTLIFTKTRGAIVGVILGGVVLLAVIYGVRCVGRYKYGKKILLTATCIGAVFCTCFVVTHDFQRNYDYERVLLWNSSYKMWQDHKIYGVGMGNWAREYPRYISPQAKEPNLTIPHNVVASFFDETGMIGGFGFLVYVAGTWVFLVKKINKYPDNRYYQAALWAFIALMCHGMVDTGITNRAAMQIISTILGMAIASEQWADTKSVKEITGRGASNEDV